MEIALEAAIPTYSGGLGILAGDTIRSAADLKFPMVGVTLLNRKGYLIQHLDASGWQREEPATWPVDKILEQLPPRVEVPILRRTVFVRAWKFDVKSSFGGTVPVLFLDTDLPENAEWDRTLTDYLYGGDQMYRLAQEVVLGVGGVRILRALGFPHLSKFHMNEGHSSLLTVELLREEVNRTGGTCGDERVLDAVREKCVFTTHTPVAAGHDRFPMQLVKEVLDPREGWMILQDARCLLAGNDPADHAFDPSAPKEAQRQLNLNMTYLALRLSHYVNGVAKKHGEVSRLMFAGYEIDAITNGVHAATWTSKPFQDLFDRRIPGWRQDNFSLRFAHNLSCEEIWQAHLVAKRDLIALLNRVADANLDPDALTLGFARRATPYKRADLLISNVDELKRISREIGKIQIIYAGKAHPNDIQGKDMIQHIFQSKTRLEPDVSLVYLENYEMGSAAILTAGADIWVNTPMPPMEASGTSGMKAALNGVPSFSILDGWWLEGWLEGETGWAIGEDCDTSASHVDRTACDAASLYDKLERVIVPMFYQNKGAFLDVMRHCISLNGSFFNTQRMLQQYAVKAYFI